jgi:hypothetical protein
MLQDKERHLNECTFKPLTNEGRNKKLLKEIMEAEQEAAYEQRELMAAHVVAM